MPRVSLGTLHTEVSRGGFGFCHLTLSRSDQPPLDAPAQPAAVLRVHTLRAQGSSHGSVPPADTALLPTRWWERAMPPPHHARVRGRLKQKAAKGLRLAVDVGRGARGQKGPRAVKYLAHAPRRAVPDRHASRAKPSRVLQLAAVCGTSRPSPSSSASSS